MLKQTRNRRQAFPKTPRGDGVATIAYTGRVGGCGTQGRDCCLVCKQPEQKSLPGGRVSAS